MLVISQMLMPVALLSCNYQCLHFQDFETNQRLKNLTIEFLEDIICTPTLLPSEHRAASQLLRMLTKEEPSQNIVDLEALLVPTAVKIIAFLHFCVFAFLRFCVFAFFRFCVFAFIRSVYTSTVFVANALS
jgi:hypothetical protein